MTETNKYRQPARGGILLAAMGTSSVNGPVLFDASILQREEKIPEVFVWPQVDRPSTDLALKGRETEVPLPIIDLGGFWKNDEKATKEASDVIGKACVEHGFFQVINHQVSPDIEFEFSGKTKGSKEAWRELWICQ